MVALYGRSAGGTLASALGGYRIVVADRKEPSSRKTGGVNCAFCANFSPVNSVSSGILPLSKAMRSAWLRTCCPAAISFIRCIRKGCCFMITGFAGFPDEVRFKPALVFKRAVSDAERCLGLGSGFLNEAHRQLDAQQLRLAAFGLFHGLRQFLMAVAWVHLGFLPGGGQSDCTVLLPSSSFGCAEPGTRYRGAGEQAFAAPDGQVVQPCVAYFGQRFEMGVSELAGYLDRLQSVRLVASCRQCTDRITFYDRLRFD